MCSKCKKNMLSDFDGMRKKKMLDGCLVVDRPWRCLGWCPSAFQELGCWLITRINEWLQEMHSKRDEYHIVNNNSEVKYWRNGIQTVNRFRISSTRKENGSIMIWCFQFKWKSYPSHSMFGHQIQ